MTLFSPFRLKSGSRWLPLAFPYLGRTASIASFGARMAAEDSECAVHVVNAISGESFARLRLRSSSTVLQ
eukprot:10903062-Heterocapsa_arctica.AAC.1